MFTELQAPHRITIRHNDDPTIFLAGSIEMGAAVNWQARVSEALRDIDCIVLNPRRDDWDSSWVQDITNPKFYEQVTWELDYLDEADIIAMHFEPGTMSPITLLELGLFNTRGLIVHCPEGFWRKGNVDIVCERYNIKTVDSIEELIETVKEEVVWYG